MEKQKIDTEISTTRRLLPFGESHDSRESSSMTGRKSNLLTLVTIFLSMIIIILLLIWYYSTIYMGIQNKESMQGASVSQDDPVKRSDMVAVDKLKRTILDEKCYGITVPFEIRKISRRGACSVFISLGSPSGSFTVDYRQTGNTDVSSDILMRRANSSKYKESTLPGRNGQTFVVFHNIQNENYECTAFLQLKSVTIGITLRSDSSEDFDTQFKDILSSFYCVNECKSDTLN